VDRARTVAVTTGNIVTLIIVAGSMILEGAMATLVFSIRPELRQTAVLTGVLELPFKAFRLLLKEAEASAAILTTLAMEFACTVCLLVSSASTADWKVNINTSKAAKQRPIMLNVLFFSAGLANMRTTFPTRLLESLLQLRQLRPPVRVVTLSKMLGVAFQLLDQLYFCYALKPILALRDIDWETKCGERFFAKDASSSHGAESLFYC
jgi:hypothetical protein